MQRERLKREAKGLLKGVEFESVDDLIDQLEEFRKALASGLLETLIMGDSPDKNDETLKALFGEDFDREGMKRRVNEAMQSVGSGRGTLKDAFGFNAEAMEAFYYMGHGLFKQGNYPAARKVFKMLCMLDPVEGRYYHALASTQHQQKDYLAAIKSYMTSYAYSAVEDPAIHFHCADCYIKMDDSLSAIISLGSCVSSCDDRSEKHRLMKMRAASLREALLKRVKQEYNEEELAQRRERFALKEAKHRGRMASAPSESQRVQAQASKPPSQRGEKPEQPTA